MGKDHLCAFLDASLLTVKVNVPLSTARYNFFIGPGDEMQRSSTVHSFTVLWQQKRFLTVIWTTKQQRYKYIAVFSLTIFTHPFLKCRSECGHLNITTTNRGTITDMENIGLK